MTIDTERDSSLSKLYRLIDANLNRLREGIRVLEDIERFICDNKQTSQQLKELRHQCRVTDYKLYLHERDIIGDVLKETTASESKREDIDSLKLSNMKRAQESARVLEEGFKLVDPVQAEVFKQIRYTLYDIEKSL
ncbi:MAG: thiamine-phosphate pyrophosphorylase [Sulfurospirillum sp.]|nr:MAG: thiamine-phosphate pyrophosphorylase [Sulfurospirillum sp.]